MSGQIVPKGAAVHTRDIARGKDYAWYIKKGDLWLFDRAEDIYRIALRDTSGETRKLALLNAEKRIGIMLCDMESERIDHGNRIIYDTLYVEFEEALMPQIMNYASCLLVCSGEEYITIQRMATAYAEKLYHKPEAELEQYSLSCSDNAAAETISKLNSGKQVLPSAPENFQRCAAYLKTFANHRNISSFVFISTGRVGIERCKQVADKYDHCLILTMSAEIKADTDMRDTPIVKGLFRLWNRIRTLGC